MKASVLMITYNHGPFIAEAIESVLMQQVDFDYELVISDDCSNDGTREIVQAYQEQYPDRIKLLLPEKNLGMHRNFVQTLYACQGQYVAVLEGDDYWTSKDKLQQQADFLDRNSDFAICFHNALMRFEDVNIEPVNLCTDDFKPVFTLRDLLRRNIIPTCTAMFRHGLVREFPDWFFQTGMADWPFNVFNAMHGKIGYLNRVMAVYRSHEGGVWSGLSKARTVEELAKVHLHLNAYLNYEYDEIISAELFKQWLVLAGLYANEDDFVRAKEYALKCVNEGPAYKHLPAKSKILLRAYAPSLFTLLKKSFFLFRSQGHTPR